MNFDVVVVEGADRSAWSSAVWLVEDAAGWRGQGADVDDAVPAVSFDLGHGSVEVTDSSGDERDVRRVSRQAFGREGRPGERPGSVQAGY